MRTHRVTRVRGTKKEDDGPDLWAQPRRRRKERSVGGSVLMVCHSRRQTSQRDLKGHDGLEPDARVFVRGTPYRLNLMWHLPRIYLKKNVERHTGRDTTLSRPLVEEGREGPRAQHTT